MEWLPELKWGWLNGGLLLALLVVTDGILFLAFRRETVERLFDRSGWNRWQVIITVAGKLLALVTIVLIVFSPLKLGNPVFIVGLVLVGLGLIGLVKALFDFRSAPPDQPVTHGIYRFSRHPQIIASSIVILGSTIAIGSWLALFLFILARIFLHANLVAEEEVCLREFGDAYLRYMERVPRYLFFF
jgi:protein-S-isoprenylcysteine O-methyltransferase Ste14